MKNSDLKHDLLKESESRVKQHKEASLEKQGMAAIGGTGDFNNSTVNFRVFERPVGRRVEEIKAEIERTFSQFMKERTAALSAQFSESGQRETRSTSRTVIVPQLQDQPKKHINLPPDQSTMQIPGFPRQPSAKEGTIYFRWGWKRTILPSNNGVEQAQAETFMEELNDATGMQYEIPEFINDMEESRMPLISYCNTMELKGGSDQVSSHLMHFSQEPWQDPSFQSPMGARNAQPNMAENPLLNTTRQIQDFNDRRKSQNQKPIALSNRVKSLTFSNDDIRHLSSHSILVRCLFHKIIAGYTLNEQSLLDECKQILRDKIQEHNQSFNLDRDQRDKMAVEWQRRYTMMRRMFKRIEANAPREWMRIQEEQEDPSVGADVLEPGSYEVINYLGLMMKGKNKGKTINPRGYTMSYKYFGARSLQQLLRHTTVPNPQNALDGTPVIRDPNTFLDPNHKMKYANDGMSDSTINEMAAENQTTIALPPMRTFDRESTDRREQRRLQEATKRGEVHPSSYGRYPVIFDTKTCNLGGHHSAKQGEGVALMAQKYGPWARETWGNLNNMFQDGHMSEEFAQVFDMISKGFFGAEVFQRNIQKYDDAEQYQKWVQSHQLDKVDEAGNVSFTEDNPRSLARSLAVAKNPQIFQQLKQNGYYISKLMDLISALVHRSCKSTVTIVHDDEQETKQEITRYGQNYSTSSGVGGGGEILLSVKYAYTASVEDFLGSPEAEAAYKQAKQKDKLPGKWQDTPVRQPSLHNVSPDPVRQEQDMIMPPISPESPAIQYSERMTFWLGASAAIPRDDRDDFGTGRFAKRAETDSWSEMMDELSSRFPQLEEEVGDLLPTVNLNMQQLQKDVKKVIAATRDAIKAPGAEEGVQNAIIFTDHEGLIERLESGPVISAFEDDVLPESETTGEEPVTEEISAFEPDQPQPANQPEEVIPLQPLVEDTTFSIPSGGENYTYNFPSEEPQIMPRSAMKVAEEDLLELAHTESEEKPLETPADEIAPEYIGKDKGKRRLIRHGPDVMTGKLRPASVIDRLITVANRLDEHGEKKAANKIDYILRYLKGKECSKKEQSLQVS